MKLELQLIPSTAFFQSLRKALGPRWALVSKAVRDSKGRTCEICGWVECPPSYTECHEVWDFDTKAHKQILKGFECLCPVCHQVHHWYHSKGSGVDMKALVDHACKINNCSIEEWKLHIETATDKWYTLSAVNFELDTQNFDEKVIKWTKVLQDQK